MNKPTVTLPDGSTLVRNDFTADHGDLAIVHNGTSSHLTTMKDPSVIAYSPSWLHIRNLQPGDLDGFKTVILADRMHPELLQEHAAEFRAVAEEGNTLVVLGINEVQNWLAGISHRDAPTNFWWWSTGEDPGIRPTAAGHEAWQYLSPKSVIWHQHGSFTVEHEVTSLLELEEPNEDGTWSNYGSLLFEDTTSTAGRIIVTSLDPIFHHGSNFMPGATRFLYGLLRWTDATRRA
ncbi:hypothetical protein [Corynebacterium sp. A21]|uniref:hypothetical protein n=1 Tax=Corynebacterium sp. A21 TaxID=3457318 RepID=UPI003FD469D1